MANIFLTPTAEFKPFSYAEMLAPIAAYQEAYDAYDAQLNTLAEDAATKAFNFAAQDTKEKAQYDAIMKRLKDSADALLTNGLNADIMREIRSINKDYRTSMIPLHQKIAKRAELANEQRKLLSSNPDLRFTVDYSTASLDNITSSSSYGIINLDKIYKDTATEFAGKTSKIQREDFDPIPIGSTGYYNVKTGYGYTPEEFKDAFYGNNGSPKTDSDIYKFYKEKVDAINARTDISNDVKIEMADAVYRGMEASAGEFTTKQIAGKNGDGSSGPNTNIGDPINTDAEGNEYYVLGTTLWKKSPKGIWNKVPTEDTPNDPNNPGGGKDGGKIVLKQNQRLLGPSVFKEINANNHYTKFKDFKKEMSEKFKNRAKSQFKVNDMPVSGVVIKYDDFEPTHPMARWILNYAGSEEAIYEYTFYYNLDTGDIFATQGKQVKPTKKANTSVESEEQQAASNNGTSDVETEDDENLENTF
jgi:hypothetical protein